MRKRTIPLLVGSMTLALLGIIFIQYKWIEESYSEKQKLVEHKVYEMVDNIDQQLTDLNALAFVSTIPVLDSAFQIELLKPFDFSQFDTTLLGDSMLVSYHQTYIDSLRGTEMDLQLTTTDHITNLEVNEKSDSVIMVLGNVHSIDYNGVDLDEIHGMVERIQLEIGGTYGNSRLDSTTVSHKLIRESSALGLKPPVDWGVYDNLEKKYTIAPKKNQKWDYELPLFKKDILNPNRYFIRLENSNNNTFIWKEIALMISLSLLFIAIITFVFIYSVRLIIKHKKISEIKSDFINNMTHEFKTPLASISLAADSIIHPKVRTNPEKIDHYVSIIQVEKTKLNQHIETILEIASLKENDVAIELTRVDLNACLHESVAKLNLLIVDKACDIHFDLEPDTFVYANAYHLENVFSNLIENGIKYSPDGSKITLHSSKKGNHAFVSIKDEGIGMTKEQLNRAFDHFYRAQKGNIHNTKGFGLGLSFVKYLIHKMNSTIKIESELNKGTIIFIEFPLCP